MDRTTAQQILENANNRLNELAEEMQQLREQELAILKQAAAIASENDVTTAAATIGLIPRGSKLVRVLEGSGVINGVVLGKLRHKRETALPLIDGSADWITSRPYTESWVIGSAPLVNAKELFGEPARTTPFLGL